MELICVTQRRLVNWITVGAALSASFVTCAGFLSPPQLIGALLTAETKVNLGG